MLFNSGLAFLLVSAVLANQNPQLSKRDEKSNRWAGVEALGESNGAVTGLDITFNVPRITGSFSSPFNIIAGLDGIPADALECPYSVQVGLEVKPSKEGKPSYRAWYKRDPDVPKHDFDLPVSAGDQIEFIVKSITSTHAIVVVQNLNTKQMRGENLSSSHAICERAAIVVVAPHNHEVPIANFGKLIFSNGTTSYNGPIKSYRVDLVQHGKITARTPPHGSLLIEYVG